MKKLDLKTGYLVKYRNGNLRMVMPSSEGMIFVGEDGGHMFMNDYNEDLLCETGKAYDIMEVWGFSDFCIYALKVKTDNRKLLWSREDKKEMTISEIEKELGYSIKIVKD